MEYSNDELELYFEEFLQYYNIGSIRLLIYTLEVEKKALDRATKIHDKGRFKKYYTSLDRIKEDLHPDVEEQRAIKTLERLIEQRSGTKRDVKKELESHYENVMDCPIFNKLLKSAREFVST